MDTVMRLPSARPYAYEFRPESTALLVIDMQRDFLERGGYGELQCGNDEIFESVRKIVPQVQDVLKAARELGLHVMHTREGHRSDLSDLPASKRLRQKTAPSGQHTIGIGDQGPMGRLLVRGEPGHEIIDDLKPFPGELVIDKPGKGAFYATNLDLVLRTHGITHIILTGITTDVCVHTTMREANDRGYECLILSDCTGATDPSNHAAALHMVTMQGGVFGCVATSSDVIAATVH